MPSEAQSKRKLSQTEGHIIEVEVSTFDIPEKATPIHITHPPAFYMNKKLYVHNTGQFATTIEGDNLYLTQNDILASVSKDENYVYKDTSGTLQTTTGKSFLGSLQTGLDMSVKNGVLYANIQDEQTTVKKGSSISKSTEVRINLSNSSTKKSVRIQISNYGVKELMMHPKARLIPNTHPLSDSAEKLSKMGKAEQNGFLRTQLGNFVRAIPIPGQNVHIVEFVQKIGEPKGSPPSKGGD